MRILILGGDGMLGHRLFRHLAGRHDVAVTLRRDLADYAAYGMFDATNAFAAVSASDQTRLLEVFGEFQPDAVVNCIGIVKQRKSAKDAIASLEINALLPHRLNLLSRTAGARLVHLSTDCVFSGAKGGYRECDKPDADDLYGRSKLLGEVAEAPGITLRTSIIGPELSRRSSLLEWFLSQRRKRIKGFRRAIFSGFTTIELARVIERLLVEFPEASGLHHVSSDPISKYDLLSRIAAALDLPIQIEPDDDFFCDRSLDSTRFRASFDYRPPSWDAMIEELADELSAGNRR